MKIFNLMETFSQRKPAEENCGTVFGMAMDITFFIVQKDKNVMVKLKMHLQKQLHYAANTALALC